MATFLNDRLRRAAGLRRRLAPFAGDRHGTASIEFSFIAVPFLGLLFAIFQTAYLFLAQQAMDAAAQNAGRNVMTGQTMAASITDASTFANTTICPGTSNTTGWSLPSFLTCSNIIVDVRTAGSTGSTGWSNADTSQDILNGSTKFCIGTKGDVVIVRLVYPVPAYLSIVTLSTAIKSGGIGKTTSGQQTQTSTGSMVYPIMGVAAFRNEPFTPGAYVSPAGC